MIVSKPRMRALSAIGVFLLICFTLSFFSIRAVLSGAAQWYHLLVALLFFPIALIIFIRQLVNFKLITVGNNEIKVGHPFIFKGYIIPSKEIISWNEEVIKTKNDDFRKLSIKSNRHILSLSIHENTKYLEVLGYLKKKLRTRQMDPA